MSRLCWSLPSSWFVVHLVDSLSFIPIVHCIWVFCPEFSPLNSVHWTFLVVLCHIWNLFTLVDLIGVSQAGSDSKSLLPGLYPWFLMFLFWLVVCHPDCFTWPLLRSPLSLVDLYACCLLGNHVVWGGVLEYGWLMPNGSPHVSPLCPESLPWTPDLYMLIWCSCRFPIGNHPWGDDHHWTLSQVTPLAIGLAQGQPTHGLA